MEQRRVARRSHRHDANRGGTALRDSVAGQRCGTALIDAHETGRAMPRIDISDHPPVSVEEAKARREAVRERLWTPRRTETQRQPHRSAPAQPECGEADAAIAAIVDALALHFNVSAPSILVNINEPAAIEARRIAAALAVLWLKLPRAAVADHFGILEGAVTEGQKRISQILLRYAIPARAPRSEAIAMIVRELRASGALLRSVSIAQIQQAVSAAFDIPVNELLSVRRTSSIVRARQFAMALAKRLTGRSLPDIGRQFGGRDHTTVLHAVRKVAPLMARAEATLPPSASLAHWVAALKAGVDA
jgi:chromosomal replication initiation ATPase DnaA